MFEKIKDWLNAREDELDFAGVIVVLSTIFYVVVKFVNWLLVSFLEFTGLKWIVIAIVLIAAWRIGKIIYEGRDAWYARQEEDEHRFL
jgi:hypothetical protein